VASYHAQIALPTSHVISRSNLHAASAADQCCFGHQCHF